MPYLRHAVVLDSSDVEALRQAVIDGWLVAVFEPAVRKDVNIDPQTIEHITVAVTGAATRLVQHAHDLKCEVIAIPKQCTHGIDVLSLCGPCMRRDES